MFFDFSALPVGASDKLLHSTVVPRPIAWVTSEDREGRTNLAPFSFFNVFCTDPPLVGLGIGRRLSCTPKDTAKNIRETGEFVINLVSYENRLAMNITGTDADAGVDESQLAGLEMIASTFVQPRRVASSPVSIECVLHQALEFAPHRHLIVGRVLAMHVADDLVQDSAKFYVATPKLDLIGRMHGSGWYTRTDNLFQMKRV